jgi:hypothetical protein
VEAINTDPSVENTLGSGELIVMRLTRRATTADCTGSGTKRGSKAATGDQI